MPNDAFDCDVLVVGLGPVGAAMAALLARCGVSVIAIERDTVVYPLPRAVPFDHGSCRLPATRDRRRSGPALGSAAAL